MTLVAGVLSGLRVVEVSAFVAAPIAGATLAALGADVIRAEQLGGGIDAARWPMYAGRSLYRAGLDQGKRSVAVDLRSARGQALVSELIRGGGEAGGIVVTNLGRRGWIAYERLAEKRPDLDHGLDLRFARRQVGRGLHRQRQRRLPLGHRS